jgi:hypothetical protein
MAKVDTDRLSPAERLDLIKFLQDQHKEYQHQELLKTKQEFEAMAKERGFTLGQLNLAGKASRAGIKLGPRGPKKTTE